MKRNGNAERRRRENRGWAPQARGSRRRRCQGEGCGRGCPLTTGGGAGEGTVPLSEIFFLILALNMVSLVHSGWYFFLQFSYTCFTRKTRVQPL